MINEYINELVAYGLNHGLVDPEDEVYVTNRLLELFQLTEHEGTAKEVRSERELSQILNDMLEYACRQGMLEEETITEKDLFDTKIMGILTPYPSVVRRQFWDKYNISPKAATDFYYQFSQATNYIRKDRIVKDEKWTANTEFGAMDITINLSKPEKDPRDIAKAGKAKKSGYPSCLLCKENEGYAGHISHPARQNHRIIPITLCGERYNLQYSPYVYYNEHCIVFNDRHIPMKINKAVFSKLLDFVKQFPHYTVGSNADLPIVGGSILSHDHFQGGEYEFAMAKAPYETEISLKKFPDVHAGTVKWPMSVIRLQGHNTESLVGAADCILSCWREYTDEKAFIFSETQGVSHNTITPIARKRENLFELDLVLRNNITTEEFPLGVYHPHPEYHHIKKENIGLIEVMGLAVLPARLQKEMAELERRILQNEDLRESDLTKIHADWAEKWLPNYEITEGDILFDGESILDLEVDERARLGLFLAMQYPAEIPGITNAEFIRAAMNAGKEDDEKISVLDFITKLDEKMELLNMKEEMAERYLNEGFSGGEKKRNEILQLLMLEPTFALLDEIDSGLDIDALKVVSKGVNAMRGEGFGAMIITHYQRLLNYITPDVVHVMMEGRVVLSGGPELAARLEREGYAQLAEELGYDYKEEL